MKGKRSIGGRNVALRHVDHQPPAGVQARKLADQMGPMDETGLEQLASFAEHEPSWTLGKVTAERLRLLADHLAAETQIDVEGTLATLESKIRERTLGQVRLTEEEGTQFVLALKMAAVAVRASRSTVSREREESAKLEVVVNRLRAQLGDCRDGKVDVALVEGAPEGEAIAIDTYADLALELAALQDSHADATR